MLKRLLRRRRRNVIGFLVWATFALIPLASLCAGEAAPPTVPPPPPEAPAPAEKADKAAALLPDVDWSAVRQSFAEDKGALILSGNAWVRYKGTKLEADNLIFYRTTKEVYAEGNIRLRVGESEFAADVAYLDFENHSGYMVNAVVRVSAPPTLLGQKKDKTADKEANREKIRQLAPDPSTQATIRTRDPFGLYVDVVDDPQARTNLIFKAEKLIQHSPSHFSAENAFITPDDMAHPMYGAKASELELFMKEVQDPNNPGKTDLKPHIIVARKARLNILGFSLFPFPTVTYDLIKKNTFVQAHVGNSRRWGYFGMMRIGYGLGGGEDKTFDPTRIYLDVDERWKRGPGGGMEFEWQAGRRPPETEGERTRFERGQGFVRFYAIDEIQTTARDDIIRARRDLERRIQPKIDGFPRRQFDANILFNKRRRLQDAGPPSFEIDEHRDEWRGYVEFQHHQPLKRFAGIDKLELDLKYERETDRDFMLEYFQNKYLTQNQPEALASLRKPGDNYSMELLYRANPQDFDGAPARSPVDYGTFSGYEPALTYSLAPTPLPYGFYVRSELQAARMKRDFERAIYDQDGFEANRLYGNVDFTRPVKLGAVNFVPHLGTQQAAYDNSRDGESTFQGALTYGMDVTSRFYGNFPDFENDALGIRGMRHVIEPRVSYSAVGDTRESPEDLLDFDEVDDLTPVDKITLAVDQFIQTKRPNRDGTGTRTANVAGLDVALDYFPRNRDQERLLDGDALDLFRVDGFLRVVDVIKLDGSLGVSIEDGELEKAAYAITVDPGTRWRLKFEERFNFGDRTRSIRGSDQFHLLFEYRLSDRWAMSYESIQERRKSLLQRKGRQVERFTLTRSYGALEASLTYAVDQNNREQSLFGSIRPAVTYRNLIVTSNDLLVPPVEVAGDDEAPEERNFDPFDMLKKKKKQASGRKGDVPPPPSTTPDQDVPTPSGPNPDKRAGASGNSSETADPGQFMDPREMRRKPRRVDDDDWTAPAPTPASTR